MIDAVKMDVEEQNSHLAESEVARLLAVLQNAEFKRSETRNVTKDNSFKPRSLMEIAIEAQQRDAEIDAVKQAEESLAAAQRAEGVSASKAPVGEGQDFNDANYADFSPADPDLENQDSITGKNDGVLMPADGSKNGPWQTAKTDSPESPISDDAPNAKLEVLPDTVSGDQSSDVSGNSAEAGLATDNLANNAAKQDLLADNSEGDAAQDSQIAANFETVTAAFERGSAEGMIAGRDAGIAEAKAAAEAAAEANLADKIAAFDAALMALAKPQALQSEDLSRSIQAAILKLASKLAGQQIDETPKNFLSRIEALVTSIGQKMTAGKVHINADDYKVMLPYLADKHFGFIAEAGLARGDVILKFAGVELHDIAEARLGRQYAETSNIVVETPLEAAGLDLGKISTVSGPTESGPTESVPAETQPAEIHPLETTQAESASKIRPMTTLRPLETNNDAADNSEDDHPDSPSDETSS